MTRALRRLVGRVMVGVMLLAQLLVGAHACPALSGGAAQGSPVAAVAGACEGMAGMSDPAHPGLCATHCKADPQSSQVDIPPVPAVALVSLYTVLPTVPEAVAPMSATAASVDSAALAPPPPHAILHCCIRT
jgi:hypothetical protein